MRFVTNPFRAAAALLALLATPSAWATVIDFETVLPACDYSFNTQGFIFQNALNAPNLCVQNQITRELGEFQGGSYQDQSILLYSATSGATFSLNSFELNEYPLAGLNTVNITGYKTGGTQVTWAASLDGAPGKQTAYLPSTFTNLTQVVFLGANRSFYLLDGITVNETFTPVSNVPLPAGLPLALSGLATLLGLRRRQIAVCQAPPNLCV